MKLSKRVKGTITVVFFLLGFFLFQSFAGADTAMKAVKPAEVCMVNNTFMGKPQIPVKFEGKTYYGCCEGCATRLKEDRSARYAKDPQTGKEVDKAKAFITATPEGEALYFESQKTAESYYASRKK